MQKTYKISMQRILSASGVLAFSSIVVIFGGVARNKAFALWLGVEAVGTLGILMTLLGVLATFFTLGLGQSGIQQIAAVKLNSIKLKTTIVTLLKLGSTLAVISSLLIVGLHQWLAIWVFGSTAHSELFLWVALALFMTVLVNLRLAILSGLHLVHATARANALGALFGTILTLLAIWFYKEAALGFAFAIPSVATWFFAWLETRDMVYPNQFDWLIAKHLIQLGAIIAVGILLTLASQFFARIVIERFLGLTQTGLFQAAWNVSGVYLGFLLTGLSAEYFPRLSGAKDNPKQLHQMISDQIFLVVTIAMPLILFTILIAPYLITFLYSTQFLGSVSILRWQLAGDVLKLICWCLSFVLLARAAKGKFFLSELFWSLIYFGMMVFFVNQANIESTGLPYFFAYLASLFFLLILCYLEIQFIPKQELLLFLIFAIFIPILCVFLLNYQGFFGIYITFIFLIIYSIFTFSKLKIFLKRV